MSLEQQITQLVEAANALTGSVSGKIGQIDQRMDAAEVEFDEWRNQKDVEGDPAAIGTIRRNITQGHIYNTGVGGTGAQSVGAVPTENLGTNDLVYVHFKTPLNVNIHSEMFWFNIKGYSYGSTKIVDETIAAYCYKPSLAITSKAAFGNMTPDVYKDTAGNVILRILLPSSYYTTLRVDTMRVGNGRLFNLGDLQVKLSLTATVEF